MNTIQSARSIVEEVLFSNTSGIRREFSNCISEYLPSISESLALSISEMHEYEKFAGSDEIRQTVGHLLFGSIQGSLVAMRLFLEGLLIQSGNTQRQVIESISLSILCSKPSLGYLGRFSKGAFSSSKALNSLIRQSKTFKLNDNAVSELKAGAEFYNKFSHPTLMTVALNSSFSDPNKNYYGGYFDKEKSKQYLIEAEGRAKLLTTYPNLITGIKRNLEDDT